MMLTRSISQKSLSLNFSSLTIRMLLSFCYRRDIFHMGISSPAFEKKKEDQSVFLVYAVF